MGWGPAPKAVEMEEVGLLLLFADGLLDCWEEEVFFLLEAVGSFRALLVLAVDGLDAVAADLSLGVLSWKRNGDWGRYVG